MKGLKARTRITFGDCTVPKVSRFAAVAFLGDRDTYDNKSKTCVGRQALLRIAVAPRGCMVKLSAMAQNLIRIWKRKQLARRLCFHLHQDVEGVVCFPGCT